MRTQADEDYTSHNTRRLNVEETIAKIKTTEYIQEMLTSRKARHENSCHRRQRLCRDATCART